MDLVLCFSLDFNPECYIKQTFFANELFSPPQFEGPLTFVILKRSTGYLYYSDHIDHP